MNFLDFGNRFDYNLHMVTNNVKPHFDERNLTAADFARWCAKRDEKVTYYTARRILAGEVNIRLHTAGLVAEFLGANLDQVFPVEIE